MIIEKCPHCKVTHVQASSQWEGYSGTRRIIWEILRCQNENCNYLILIEKIDGTIARSFPLGEFQLDTTSHIPNLIRDDFQEAGICLSAGCFKASLVMSRRALQRCLKEQGCDQRNLADAIGVGIKNDILRKAFHDLAEEIRHYGNLGAHPDDEQLENANQEAASQVLEFTRLLIHEFYEVPAAAAKLKANRQKTT